MKRLLIAAILGLTAALCPAADNTIAAKVYRSEGGDAMTVASGGTLTIDSGGTLVMSGLLDFTPTDTEPSGATEGAVYWDDSENTLKIYTGVGWSAITAGVGDPVAGGTLDDAYDSGGAGAGRAIDASDGAVTIGNDDADTTNILELTKNPSGSAAGAALLVTMNSNATGAGISFANTGSGNDLLGSGSTWSVSKAGAASFASLAASNFYQTAVTSAASGNVNLTVDAAGTGTITVGGTSTGNTIFPGVVAFNGNIDIGNAATDTLTITSIIDGNVTLDDGVTDSPALIFKDATDTTATIALADNAHLGLTTAAASGLKVLTGNLWIGNGSPGTAAMNGEDLYVEGAAEFDSAVQFDGAITAAGAVTATSTVDLTGAEISGAAPLIFEGATANGSEATIAVTDPTADITWTIPTGGASTVAFMASTLATNFPDVANSVTGASNGLVFEGSTANDHEATITAADVTADVVVQIPDAAAGTYGMMLSSLATNAPGIANSVTGGTNQLVFEGSGVDAHEAVITATNPTADIVWTLADGAASTVAFMASTLEANFPDVANSVTGASNGLLFEGTADEHEITLSAVDATSDTTATLPNRSGTIALDTASVTAKTEAFNLTSAYAGQVLTNTGAGGGVEFTLPEASTVIGMRFTFVVLAAQNLDIDPDDADRILGLTDSAGDMIRNGTAGGTVTLMSVDSTNWVVVGSYGTWADAN